MRTVNVYWALNIYTSHCENVSYALPYSLFLNTYREFCPFYRWENWVSERSLALKARHPGFESVFFFLTFDVIVRLYKFLHCLPTMWKFTSFVWFQSSLMCALPCLCKFCRKKKTHLTEVGLLVSRDMVSNKAINVGKKKTFGKINTLYSKMRIALLWKVSGRRVILSGPEHSESKRLLS